MRLLMQLAPSVWNSPSCKIAFAITLILPQQIFGRSPPGASRHLGGSNRTIIKQAHEMLISPRTRVADRQVGALVSLDLLYELVEGNLSSERQKDISDIVQ